MRNVLREIRRLFTLRRVVVGVAILLALSFVPWGRAPSLAGWVQAYIRGGGKPHFPIPGTPESRFENFLKRHPEFLPQWRKVPEEENGFLKLLEFVKSEAAYKIAVKDELNEMLYDERKWDQNAARKHGEKHHQELNELRRIALLPQRSSEDISRLDDMMIQRRTSLWLSKALRLSMKCHMRSNDVEDAFTDFSALYGLASHVDRHEVASIPCKIVGSTTRFYAREALIESLHDMPSEIDWTPWIQLLAKEPYLADDMAKACLGDVWCAMHFYMLNYLMVEEKNNTIWDFTAFEDAYAERLRIFPKTFARKDKGSVFNEGHVEENQHEALESGLSAAARDLLRTVGSYLVGLENGFRRQETHAALTLAALQLLDSERSGGPIQTADDPRLGQLAIDPSNGKPFVFDPAKRQLSAAEGSALQDEDTIQLPSR